MGAGLTHDKFQRRGFSLCSRCFFCENSLASTNHLLLHCNQVQKIWSFFLNLFGVWQVTPREMRVFSLVGRLREPVENWRHYGRSHYTFCGLTDQRETKDVLKGKKDHISSLTRCLENSYFWCKGYMIEDTTHFFGFFGTTWGCNGEIVTFSLFL